DVECLVEVVPARTFVELGPERLDQLVAKQGSPGLQQEQLDDCRGLAELPVRLANLARSADDAERAKQEYARRNRVARRSPVGRPDGLAANRRHRKRFLDGRASTRIGMISRVPDFTIARAMRVSIDEPACAGGTGVRAGGDYQGLHSSGTRKFRAASVGVSGSSSAPASSLSSTPERRRLRAAVRR